MTLLVDDPIPYIAVEDDDVGMVFIERVVIDVEFIECAVDEARFVGCLVIEVVFVKLVVMGMGFIMRVILEMGFINACFGRFIDVVGGFDFGTNDLVDGMLYLYEFLDSNEAKNRVTGLQDASYIAEQLSGKSCLLALRPIDEANVKEVVLWVQHFIIEASLPPYSDLPVAHRSSTVVVQLQRMTGVAPSLKDNRVAPVVHTARTAVYKNETRTLSYANACLGLGFLDRHITPEELMEHTFDPGCPHLPSRSTAAVQLWLLRSGKSQQEQLGREAKWARVFNTGWGNSEYKRKSGVALRGEGQGGGGQKGCRGCRQSEREDDGGEVKVQPDATLAKLSRPSVVIRKLPREFRAGHYGLCRNNFGLPGELQKILENKLSCSARPFPLSVRLRLGTLNICTTPQLRAKRAIGGSRDGQDLTLTFGNRYLTSSGDIGGNVSINMLPIVDPLNVLHPLIKTEVHTADNVVEYWEHRGGHTTSEVYTEIKPGLFTLTNLVEVQVSFAIIRVARQEYAFIPKLRAICLLNHIVEMDYNLSAIRVLVSGQLLLLKKIKCKVGYRMSSLDESAPNKHLRRLTLSEAEVMYEHYVLPKEASFYVPWMRDGQG
ncbi:hypothetical protein V8D89_015859 [Ganoderma adspersum]